MKKSFILSLSFLLIGCRYLPHHYSISQYDYAQFEKQKENIESYQESIQEMEKTMGYYQERMSIQHDSLINYYVDENIWNTVDSNFDQRLVGVYKERSFDNAGIDLDQHDDIISTFWQIYPSGYYTRIKIYDTYTDYVMGKYESSQQVVKDNLRICSYSDGECEMSYTFDRDDILFAIDAFDENMHLLENKSILRLTPMK